jgi:hypothetical protein
MVDVTPGNLGANKGHWAKQLRDRFSRFMEEGSFVLIEIELPGVYGKVHATGKLIRAVSPGVALVRVETNKEIPAGDYEVSTENITAIQATIPLEHVEKKAAEARGETAPAEAPLKKSMSGTEALNLRLKSMGNLLREDGRFPTPRMSILDRKDSDNRRAAQRDYKKVFDAEPALQEKYKTFENMWEQVYKYGTDERTKSPNVLADIPEDMKELNRAYAKHFLGLDPEGLITVYRNAVNGKDTPEESAVGYASTDALMAYDYASHRDNVAANGRYEIDVKPGEIFGMLGYSRIEDEYGVTIGRELANIPGRVRRVGDLAMVLPEAPWLKEWGLNFNRGKGASPFRQYTLATSHDFHAVEPFGESLEEFFTKYNLSAADIKKKFDQIYGEGAYDRYKATGNSVSFQRIRDLFVKLENGQIGLDVKKLENLAPLREVSEYTGDLFDNTLKMLSVFQELTGQYFMTHKTRDYAPPVVEAEPKASGVTSWTSPPTEAQLKALEDYASGELANSGNTYLRTGDLPAPYAREEGEPESMADFKAQLRAEVEQQIQDLSSAFETSVLSQDVAVYRSLEDPRFNFDSNLELKDGESLDLSYLEGTIYSDKGFMSTSKTTNFAFDARNFSTRFIIKAKAGQKAIDLLGAIRFDALAREEEIIFPPNAQFKISKAYYKDGKYYLEMDYLDTSEETPTALTQPGATEAPEISIQIGDMSEASIEFGYANWMASALEFLDAAGEEEEEWQGEEEEEEEEKADNSGTNTRGNLLQSMFLEAAAYNGKPRLVSQEEFDAINSETVYRGVSDKIFVDDYLNSSIQYAGEGSFGNGTYTTNRRETTEFYAGDKSDSRGTLAEKTMELKLAPDANILSFDEVTEMREWATEQGNEFMGRSEQLGANPAQMQAIDWHLLNASDWTNLAIMLGYDAVRFKVPMTENEEYYTIILNRGKVIAKQPIAEVASPSVIPPGAENWIPVLTDTLKLTADSDSEDNNFDPELGNKRLSIVMEMAGYNAKPKLASQEEFDSIEGEPIYRGITAEGAVDQYINSPKHFAGTGKFGNGTYSTNDRKTALLYGGGSENNLLEMKLSPDANVQKFDSRKDYLDWIEDTMAKIKEDYANSGASNEEYYDFIRQVDNVADWTNVAVMLGIDAIEFPPSAVLGERYTIILNRGKVIVNGKS